MIINRNNRGDTYPSLKEIEQRIVRATVWNLDGTTSEMKFYYPNFCNNGDSCILMGQHIEEWIRNMTRFFLQISHYKIDFGTLWKNGTESFGGMAFQKREVPLNKVFVPKKIEQGKWHSVRFDTNKRTERKHRHMTERMNKGEHPLSGALIRAKGNKNIWMN